MEGVLVGVSFVQLLEAVPGELPLPAMLVPVDKPPGLNLVRRMAPPVGQREWLWRTLFQLGVDRGVPVIEHLLGGLGEVSGIQVSTACPTVAPTRVA